MGDLFVDGFTNDAAGQEAKQIADILYVFPRRDQPNPVTLGANRQADIVDMRNGYFSFGSATPNPRRFPGAMVMNKARSRQALNPNAPSATSRCRTKRAALTPA